MSPPRRPGPPFGDTGLPQGPRVPCSPGIPTPAHHRRRGWGRGGRREAATGGGALTCSRSGLPAPTGDEVPEQAIRWAPARSSFQELGSAPRSASPQPPIQRLHPPQEGKWGAKLGYGSQERAAPPRAVSSPCRAPPGAARLACGGAGQPGGGAATSPARCRPSMPSAAAAPGSPGQPEQSCLERSLGVGRRLGSRARARAHPAPPTRVDSQQHPHDVLPRDGLVFV